MLYRLVAHMSPGRKQAPNPMYFRKRNVETPYHHICETRQAAA